MSTRYQSALEIEIAARELRDLYLAQHIRRGLHALARALKRLLAPSPAAELHAMDDRQLADLGITRYDIPHVVKYGRQADPEVRTAPAAANADAKPTVWADKAA